MSTRRSKNPGTLVLPLRFDDPRSLRDADKPHEKNGVVYTRPWVVSLILDLAGYCAENDLATKIAVEPASGNGAFLLPMAQRLIESCRKFNRPLEQSLSALLSYELNETNSQTARLALSEILFAAGASVSTAESIASAWLRTGDYLLDATILPPVDFVIGNPPYVRLEDIDPAVASIYRATYTTMVGRADLYVAFFEAALRQLKAGGTCAFICSDRWMLNQYGSELRWLITRSFGVEAIVEMHKAEAFDAEVSAYPAVTVIRRNEQRAAVVASANPDSGFYDGAALAKSLLDVRESGEFKPQLPNGVRAARITSWFSGADPWPCVSPERLELLKRLEEQFFPLESAKTNTVVGIGVATGCDEVFITSDANLVEQSRLLPLAMANDAQEGQLNWSGRYLVDPWDNDGLIDLDHYPRLAAYFGEHAERLSARNVAQRNHARWYRTIDRVHHALLSKAKLYIPDIKNRISPVYDGGATYPHHNLYYVQSDTWDIEVLAGLLLSGVAQFFVECYGVRMRGGYLRFQAQYLRRIRVPDHRAISIEQAERLRNAFRRYDVQAATEVALDLYHISSEMGELVGH